MTILFQIGRFRRSRTLNRAVLWSYRVLGVLNGIGAAWLIAESGRGALDWLLAAGGVAVSIALLRSQEYRWVRKALAR